MEIPTFDELTAIDSQKENPDSWLWPEDPFKLDSASHIGQHGRAALVVCSCFVSSIMRLANIGIMPSNSSIQSMLKSISLLHLCSRDCEVVLG